MRNEGRERLTTNRVAEVAGVSVGSLYQYFPNKQSLLDALAERYDAQFLARLIRAFGKFGGRPLREGLRELARFTIEIHGEDPELHNALSPVIPKEQHQTILELVRTGLEPYRGEIRLGRSKSKETPATCLAAATSQISGL